MAIGTWNNGKTLLEKPTGLLEAQLDLLGMEYTVLSGDDDWKSLKIESSIEFLKSIDKPYVLFADSSDVALLRSPEELLRTYLTDFVHTPVVYNACPWDYPQDEETFAAEKELAGDKRNCSLNSGAVIGRRESLIEFYEECLRIADNPELDNNDQLYARRAHVALHPKVQLDYTNQLFTVLLGNQTAKDYEIKEV
jgi:hypothetical protein